MAATDPPSDHGNDSSIDLQFEKDEEKKLESKDLFEDKEDQEINNDIFFKSDTENIDSYQSNQDSKNKISGSGNTNMTTVVLDEATPLMDSINSSSIFSKQSDVSELVGEVNRLSLDQSIPSVESPSDIAESSDNYWINITVNEPKKIDEGVNAYIVYKIRTQTNLPAFHKHNVVVHRRFSDFLGLHSRLADKYAKEGRIIPPAPEKSIIGMAKVKVSKNESASGSEFVEQRRAQLERFLKHLSVSLIFRSDPCFVDFLEAEGDLERSSHTSTLSGVSVKKLFSKVGDGFNRVALRIEEKDSWYGSRNDVLYQSESSFKNLQSAMESVISHRRDCAAEMDLLSQDLLMLSKVEDDPSISKALSQLAELWLDLRDSNDVQANDDSVCLLEFIKDSLGMIHSYKNAMTERLKVYKLLKDSEAILNRKKEQEVKLKDHSKVSRTLPGEIAQCEANVEKYREDFERVSTNLKVESLRIDKLHKGDFKENLISSLESALANQQRSLKLWEAFLENTKKLEKTTQDCS